MRYVVIIAWCAILLGILLRVTQLPTRAVYSDEVYTQLRVAGHTAAEMIGAFYNGRPTTARVLSDYAIVDATSSPGRLVASLEQEDSQHPPLFYLMELGFIKAVGNGLVFWRLLPALFGILAIPAAYALGRELFKTHHAALLGAALFAVSPIERIYSDQAREYSLFTLLVLLSTLAVVRAARSNTVGAWIGYAVLATAGLYTDPIMAYVLAAHAVYTAGMSWQRRHTPAIIAFGAASAASILAYLPWIYQMLIHRNDIAQTNIWSGTHWPLLRLVAKWAFNTGTTFFDLEYIDLRWGAAAFVVVGLIALVAVIRGFRAADTETRWCLGATILVPALLLAAPDVILGEHRSSVARYGLPVYAMLTFAIARGLVGRPLSASIVLGAALCSCVVGALHPSWWDNDINADDVRIAQTVSAVPRAQILTPISPPQFIHFARLLDPDQRLSLSPNLSARRFSPEDPVFVLFAPEDGPKLREHTGLRLTPVAYGKALTAHDIGASIAAAGAAGVNTDLFRLSNGQRAKDAHVRP